MDALIRGATLGAVGFLTVTLLVGSAALGQVPEWQQDLDYLTWDRRQEVPAADAGGPVFLQPGGESATISMSSQPSASWRLRIRDFYSLVTPRSLRALVTRREVPGSATSTDSVTASATLTVPAPGQTVQQPLGPVAERHDATYGTFRR
jgi:hypothetical protein